MEKTNVDLPTPDLGIDDSTNEVATRIVEKIDSIVTELPQKLNDSINLDKARKDTRDNFELAQKQRNV